KSSLSYQIDNGPTMAFKAVVLLTFAVILVVQSAPSIKEWQLNNNGDYESILADASSTEQPSTEEQSTEAPNPESTPDDQSTEAPNPESTPDDQSTAGPDTTPEDQSSAAPPSTQGPSPTNSH
ncbi:hypothetical protein NQ315_007364, partial [Exocentrus adspersus]